jgi:plasmid stabilization system protein ParE
MINDDGKTTLTCATWFVSRFFKNNWILEKEISSLQRNKNKKVWQQQSRKSVETFGKRVASEFYREIKDKIIRLRTIPNMYSKCHFVDSSETKTYRNIIVRGYLVVFSVTASQITVIDILHQSVSPENMRRKIE